VGRDVGRDVVGATVVNTEVDGVEVVVEEVADNCGTLKELGNTLSSPGTPPAKCAAISTRVLTTATGSRQRQ